MITKAKAIETAAGDFKKAEAATYDSAVESMKQGAATASAGMEQVQTQAKEGLHKVMKTAEQVTQFSQGNVEAFVKSSQILTTGLTDLSKMMAASARASMDETMSIFKAMSTVKSFKEAFELQSSFARTSMEKALSESGRLTEHSMKLAEQAFAPISARVNAAVETFS